MRSVVLAATAFCDGGRDLSARGNVLESVDLVEFAPGVFALKSSGLFVEVFALESSGLLAVVVALESSGLLAVVVALESFGVSAALIKLTLALTGEACPQSPGKPY